MPKEKGSEKTGGRIAGTPNKITKTVKEVFANVFSKLQDHPEVNLEAWGEKNPTEFYKLSSKLIPTELAGSVDITSIKVSVKKKQKPEEEKE